MSLGNASGTSGNFSDAVEHFAEARSYFAAVGDDTRSAQVLRNWGHIELQRGQVDRAAELLAESLALARRIANDRQLAFTLSSIGMARLSQGDVEAARTSIHEALDKAVLAEDDGLTLDCVEYLASLLAARQQWEPAARLFGFAEAFRLSTGLSDVNSLRVSAPYLADVRGAMTSETLTRAWTSGRGMTLADAVAQARSLDP